MFFPKFELLLISVLSLAMAVFVLNVYKMFLICILPATTDMFQNLLW